MSDNPTRETPDSRSFEERIFARFDAFERRLDAFEGRFDAFEGRFDAFERRMEARFARLEEKVDAMDTRLTALEEKVDERLRETRPIWEAVQADLEYIKGEVKSIGRAIKLLHEDNLRIRINQDELRERIEKLESELSRNQ